MSSSEEYDDYPEPSTSTQKPKRTYTKCTIPLEKCQRCIATSMANIITKMVNKELQQRCKDLLEMEDMNETEARILYVLEQIDGEREKEEQLKAAKRKRKARK